MNGPFLSAFVEKARSILHCFSFDFPFASAFRHELALEDYRALPSDDE
jgi:hypothetical protein